MREIFLSKKTGFEVTDRNKPVIIRDNRGLMFYNTEAKIPNVARFNIAPYFRLFIESGNIRQRIDPVNHKLLRLPKPDRDQKKDPRKFRLTFMKNPNQVTVDWGREMIIFDRSFLEKPIPEIYWAFFHECGHRYWDKGQSAEMACDEYAVNQMLKFGFNPSQCGYAILNALGRNKDMPEDQEIAHPSFLRKKNLAEKVIKYG